MAVQILLSSSLRKHIPDYNPATGVELVIRKGMTVADICRQLDIPTELIKIVMVNGIGKSLEHTLGGNERVGLFPPVGGG